MKATYTRERTDAEGTGGATAIKAKGSGIG